MRGLLADAEGALTSAHDAARAAVGLVVDGVYPLAAADERGNGAIAFAHRPSIADWRGVIATHATIAHRSDLRAAANHQRHHQHRVSHGVTA